MKILFMALHLVSHSLCCYMLCVATVKTLIFKVLGNWLKIAQGGEERLGCKTNIEDQRKVPCENGSF